MMDEGGEPIDVIGVSMGQDHTLEAMGINPTPQQFVGWAAGAVDEESTTGAIEDEEGIIPFRSGHGVRRAQNHDPLPPLIVHLNTMVYYFSSNVKKYAEPRKHLITPLTEPFNGEGSSHIHLGICTDYYS